MAGVVLNVPHDAAEAPIRTHKTRKKSNRAAENEEAQKQIQRHRKKQFNFILLILTCNK
jgi:hypothetical protein